MDGELVSSPRIITRSDQRASINISDRADSSSLRMELIASDASNAGTKDAIKINYDIQYKNGKENVSSKPCLIVVPKKPAAVSFTTGSGHLYKILVLANRE